MYFRKSDNNVIDLLAKLISIPSYVDGKNDEVRLADMIINLVKRNCKWLKIKKQPVERGRYNLIIKDKYPTKILVIGHLDTVNTQSGWWSNPLKAEIKDNCIYGLGSTDMKGSLAAFLSALFGSRATKGLMMLLYIDEEYDLKGMKRFTEEFKKYKNIKPEFILSLDGAGLKLESGCRGCIEINFKASTRGGHSANPKNGINIVIAISSLVKEIQRYYFNKKDRFLGPTTVNLAYIQAGVKRSNDTIGREGNMIPSYADFTIEVRPSIKGINAKGVTQKIKSVAKRLKINILSTKTRHDLGILPIGNNKDEILSKLLRITQVKSLKLRNFYTGYIDAQMLYPLFNCPIYILGAGNNTAHGPNEYIGIEALLKAKSMYRNLLNSFAKIDNGK